MIGTILDQRYQVTKPLSRGAFGHTFQAEDTKRPQNPICVVKQLKPRETKPEYLIKAQELFNREAEALELLGKHPQIPSLLAHLEINGEFYLVEEYIPGQTLAEEFAAQGKKSEPEVIQLIFELLKIITFIHHHKIIHRDIKPSNIIRHQETRKLVLIDFGTAMEYDGQTFLSTVIGTPGYIAPEQSEGLTKFCSDIYAVGIIGLQALTGINPNLFTKDDLDKNIWQNQVSISQKFADILTKMIRTNESDRYNTATEVLDDINSIREKISPPPLHLSYQKILLPSLLLLLAIPLFLWLKPIVNKSYNMNLPLNGKVLNNQLNDHSLCQDTIVEQDVYCQKYTLIGQKNQEVTIEMNSDDFDPLLILQNPNGTKLEHNSDRSVNNWNAQIKAKLPIDGNYTVITRTTSPGETGNYTIRARINNN